MHTSFSSSCDVICLYLVHAIVQGHISNVFDVLAVFGASQLYQQVMPLPVIDSNLWETQRRHQLLLPKHLHTNVLLSHLNGGKKLYFTVISIQKVFWTAEELSPSKKNCTIC